MNGNKLDEHMKMMANVLLFSKFSRNIDRNELLNTPRNKLVETRTNIIRLVRECEYFIQETNMTINIYKFHSDFRKYENEIEEMYRMVDNRHTFLIQIFNELPIPTQEETDVFIEQLHNSEPIII
jgi:hypothetical protein